MGVFVPEDSATTLAAATGSSAVSVDAYLFIVDKRVLTLTLTAHRSPLTSHLSPSPQP